MKRIMVSAVVACTAALSAAVFAQASTSMAPAGQDKMSKTDAKDVTYVGCVEGGKAPHTYVLTHVAAPDQTAKKTMANDSMGKDAMGNGSVAPAATPPTALSVMSTAVDLSKQVGHKVSVTGTEPQKMASMGKDATSKDSKDSMAKDSMSMGAMSKDGMAQDLQAFTVKTLKVVATTCG